MHSRPSVKGIEEAKTTLRDFGYSLRAVEDAIGVSGSAGCEDACGDIGRFATLPKGLGSDFDPRAPWAV